MTLLPVAETLRAASQGQLKDQVSGRIAGLLVAHYDCARTVVQSERRIVFTSYGSLTRPIQ